MAAATMTSDQKIKGYLKVAGILAIVTVVEVILAAFEAEGTLKTIITLAIVTLSCSKAFLVAYYYMHLNHEKPWTIWVAASPLVIIIYVAALVADAPQRKASEYIGEPARGVKYPTVQSMQAQDEAAAAEAADGASEDEGGEWE